MKFMRLSERRIKNFRGFCRAFPARFENFSDPTLKIRNLNGVTQIDFLELTSNPSFVNNYSSKFLLFHQLRNIFLTMRMARAWLTWFKDGRSYVAPFLPIRNSTNETIREFVILGHAGLPFSRYKEGENFLCELLVGRLKMFNANSSILQTLGHFSPPVQASLRDSRERLRRRFYEWWRLIKSDVGCGCPLPFQPPSFAF